MKVSINWWALGVFVLLVVAVRYLVSQAPLQQTSVGTSPFRFVFFNSLSSIVNPGTFLVSHLLWFGPMAALIFFLWPQIIKQTLQEHGMGLGIFIGAIVIMGIGSEVRYITNLWPFLVVLVCTVVGRNSQFSIGSAAIIAVIAIAISRTWLSVDQLSFEGSVEDILNFPLQRYFMNHGPWRSNQMYLVFLGVTVIVSILVFSFLKKEKLKS